MSPEQIAERVQEDLNENLHYYLLQDCKSTGVHEFFEFLDSRLSKPNMEMLINEWLETKDGKQWYEEMLEYLYSNLPDGPDTLDEMDR